MKTLPLPHQGAWRIGALSVAILGLCLTAMAQTESIDTAAATAMPSAQAKTSAKRRRHSEQKMQNQLRGPEAAAVNAIVEKHKHLKSEAAAARAKELIEMPPPADAPGRREWRKQIRAALAAERKAAKEEDDAMRAELDAADDARHPEDQGQN